MITKYSKDQKEKKPQKRFMQANQSRSTHQYDTSPCTGTVSMSNFLL